VIRQQDLQQVLALVDQRRAEHGWEPDWSYAFSQDPWWACAAWRLRSIWEPEWQRVNLVVLIDPLDGDHAWAVNVGAEWPAGAVPEEGWKVFPLTRHWRQELVPFLYGLHGDPFAGPAPVERVAPLGPDRRWGEAEWNSSTDLRDMLRVVQRRIGLRKLRLLACAWCRLAWHDPNDRRGLRAVEAAERYADGQATPKELSAAAADARGLPRLVAGHSLAQALRIAAQHSDPVALCDRVREIVGNPFCPVRVDPAWLLWRGGFAAKMARTLDRGQRFAELPILADVLEEAGCAERALLDHLRTGRHCRGCWALDALLGRT
jgi:hypothetical protein